MTRIKSPWVHAGLWACLILVATSIPSNYVVIPTGFDVNDKWAHFAMYLPFAFLVFRAIDVTWPKLSLGRKACNTFLIGSLFGALDELHQLPIPGRSCDISDWIVDALGVIVGVSIAAIASRLRSDAKSNSAARNS